MAGVPAEPDDHAVARRLEGDIITQLAKQHQPATMVATAPFVTTFRTFPEVKSLTAVGNANRQVTTLFIHAAHKLESYESFQGLQSLGAFGVIGGKSFGRILERRVQPHDTMFQDLPALKKQFNQEIRTWETKYDELEKSNSFAEWVSLVAKQYVKMDPRFGTMEPRQLEMAIKEKARRSFFETAPQDFAYFHSRLEYSAWKTQIEFMKHKLEMNLEEILASLRDMSMESYLRHEPNKVFEASPRKYVHMVFPVTVSLPVRDSFVAELFKSVP